MKLKQGENSYFPQRMDLPPFIYVINGEGNFSNEVLNKGEALILRDGGSMTIHAASDFRFILMSGKPLHETHCLGRANSNEHGKGTQGGIQGT